MISRPSICTKAWVISRRAKLKNSTTNSVILLQNWSMVSIWPEARSVTVMVFTARTVSSTSCSSSASQPANKTPKRAKAINENHLRPNMSASLHLFLAGFDRLAKNSVRCIDPHYPKRGRLLLPNSDPKNPIRLPKIAQLLGKLQVSLGQIGKFRDSASIRKHQLSGPSEKFFQLSAGIKALKRQHPRADVDRRSSRISARVNLWLFADVI